MQQQPVVSVLMTAYNQGRYIGKAIASVLEQKTTFPFGVQLVISDDASTDNTVQVCRMFQERYPDAVYLIIQPWNMGLAHSLASAWPLCHGRYIAILEADDYWCDALKLHAQTLFMESHPSYSMCFTGTDISSPVPTHHKRWPYWHISKDTVWPMDLIAHNPVANCSVMYRHMFNPFAENPWLLDLPYCDIPLHVLHAMKGPVGYLPKIMATYRLHQGSAFEDLPWPRKMEKSIIVYDAMARHLPPPYSQMAARTLALMYQGLAAFDPSRAIRHLRSGLEAATMLSPVKRITASSILMDQVRHMVRTR